MELKPQLCRICRRFGEKFLSISEHLGSLKISDHIMAITTVVILPDDGLPSSICPACIHELKAAVNFKNKCLASDIFFKSIELGDSDKKIDIKLEEDDYINEEYLEPFQNIESVEEITSYEPRPAKGQLFSPQCNECKQFFRSKCKLRVHWKKEHMKKITFMCEICKRIFKSKLAHDKHKNAATVSCIDVLKNADKFTIVGEGRNRIYQCKHCDYKSHRYIHMRTHLVVHMPGVKPFKCQMCPNGYTQRNSLKQHMMEQHDTSTKLTCYICGKISLSDRRFKRHMEVHRVASIPCPKCKLMFKTKKGRDVHLKRHSGMKEYQCEACPIAFYSSAELINHRRIHTPKAIIKCSQCEFETDNNRKLKVHEILHGGDKQCPCLKCGKFFETNQRLQLHLRKYHKPKTFMCPLCPKIYSTAKITRYHIKVKHNILGTQNVENGPCLFVSKVSSKPKTALKNEDSDEQDGSSNK